MNGLRLAMAEHGYDGASIAHIAKAAGLTAGLVHYHFGNKQEILIATLTDLVDEHRQRVAHALERAGSSELAKLAAFIDVHLKLGATADATTLASWLVISGEAMRRDEVRAGFRAAIAETVERVEALIQACVEADECQCDDPQAAAAALVAVIQGYFVLSVNARGYIPKGTAARSVKAMAEGLIKPVRPLTSSQDSAS